MKSGKVKHKNDVIAQNKKAYHEYIIEETYEAGIVLKGWEIKSIRKGRVQLVESYVQFKNDEAWLLNGLITPLISSSTHITPKANATRKLLLHRHQINKLRGKINQKGYTVVPLKMYLKEQKAKLEIALAKGKKIYDKREAERLKDWQRQKAKLLKNKIS
jgi:SsrA-binding protein